jgi:hypothetical protein
MCTTHTVQTLVSISWFYTLTDAICIFLTGTITFFPYALLVLVKDMRHRLKHFLARHRKATFEHLKFHDPKSRYRTSLVVCYYFASYSRHPRFKSQPGNSVESVLRLYQRYLKQLKTLFLICRLSPIICLDVHVWTSRHVCLH